MMYVQENDERMPGSDFWSAIDVGGKILICPTAGKKIANAYGQNSSINNLGLGEITSPEDVFLTADALPEGGNIISVNDGDARHNKGLIASYVDGHVVLHTLAPKVFVYLTNSVVQGLPVGTSIYTPADGSFDENGFKLTQNNGTALPITGRPDLNWAKYENDTLSIYANGDSNTSRAQLKLDRLYPAGLTEATSYWGFSANVDFSKSAENRSDQAYFAPPHNLVGFSFEVCVLDVDGAEIVTLYIARGGDHEERGAKVAAIYNNETARPTNFRSGSDITAGKGQIMYFKYLGSCGNNLGEFDTALKSSTPFNIAVMDGEFVVTYGKWSASGTLSGVNWKKPAIVRINNGGAYCPNQIDLQNFKFDIK